MSDQLRAAIDVLSEQLQQQQREVADTKRTINALLRRLGEQPMFSDTDTEDSVGSASIRPDEFYGKPFATAAQEFLRKRKQALSADQVVKGLEQGGFDFRNWKTEDRVRLVASHLSKNNVVFHKLPNNTFGLLSWYPDIKRERRTEKENGQTNNQTQEVEEKQEESTSGETIIRRRGRPRKEAEVRDKAGTSPAFDITK